jgi:hypothetical protein
VVEAPLMQRGRSFVVLLVVAVALGAWYFLVEADRDPLAEEPRESAFNLTPGTLEEIEVTAESGAVTRVLKTDGAWRIVEPAALDADVGQVNALVSTLESLEIQQTIDDAPASLAPYGLAPPRFSLAFRAAGESAMRRLNVGNTTPTGGDVYAAIEGQPALVLIAGYLQDALNRTTFDLRDKAVLKIARDVDAIRVERTGAPALTVARQENDWRLTAPVEARADFSAVDGLVSRVLQAQMKAITSEEASDLPAWGLDRPQATVTFTAGATQASLLIGAKADETTVYARDAARSLVFTLDATLLDELAKDPVDFRMKDLFLFRSFNALGLDLTVDGKTLTFVKATPAPAAEADPAAAPPAPVWRQTAPDAKDADQAAVTDLLTNLSNLRADAFSASAIGSGEELVVTARFGNVDTPSEERVVFRMSGDTVHAIVTGEAGAAVVPKASFESILTAVRALAGGQ